LGSDPDLVDWDGRAALAAAAASGELEVMEALLESGADVNAQTWRGETPLMVAALNGRMDSFDARERSGTY
jgi:ankyrin repeat protein